MKTISFCLLFFVISLASSQSELKNIWNSSYVLSGGPVGSATTVSEKYMFVAQKDMDLPFVYIDSLPLNLKEGDTLIYRYQYTIQTLGIEKDPKELPKFTESSSRVGALKYNAIRVGSYYEVNINRSSKWEGARSFKTKNENKLIVADLKEVFDEQIFDAAP